MKNISIRIKIFIIILMLSAFTLIIISTLTLFNIRELGRYEAESCSALGEDVAKDCRDGLLLQSGEELQALATAQALGADVEFKRIAAGVRAFAAMCEKYLAREKLVVGDKKNIVTYLSEAEPAERFGPACFHFSPGAEPGKLMDELAKAAGLQPLLKFIYRSNCNYELTYIAFPSGIYIGFPWSRKPDAYDPRTRGWYVNAAGRRDVIWTGPYVSTVENRLTLTCSKAIYDARGKMSAVCAADIEIKAMTRQFLNALLAPESIGMIVGRDGRIIVRKGMRNAGDWESCFKEENLLHGDSPAMLRLAADLLVGNKGSGRYRLQNGLDEHISYAPIPSVAWNMVIMIPEDNILRTVDKIEKNIVLSAVKISGIVTEYVNRGTVICVIFGLLVLALIIFFSIAVSRRIARPLLFLQDEVRKIGEGDLDRKIELKTGDEIEELATTFNRMADSLKEYIGNLRVNIAAKQKIEQELAIAAEIQETMLPHNFSPFPGHPEIEVYALINPAREVGGDFYDFFFIDEQRLYFSLGDVSGKGVPAALFMAITKTLLGYEAGNGQTPADILINAGNVLEKDNDACMFATVCCGVIDLRDGVVVFSNAGHPAPLRYRSGHGFEFIRPNPGIAVGPYPMAGGVCKNEKIKLDDGDILLLYSDGITEALKVDLELFGEARLLQCLNEIVTETSDIRRILSELRCEIAAYSVGTEQSDDITILALKYHRSPERAEAVCYEN